MKVFWGLIAVLVVAAGVLLVARSGDEGGTAGAVEPRAGEDSVATRDAEVSEGPSEAPAPPAAEREMDPVFAAVLNEGSGAALDQALGIDGAGEGEGGDGGAVSTEATVEERPDGTVLVDGRFEMSGSGTREDPYVVTWEQLASAQEVYKPRLGMKALPERVTMLDGKWVRIGGYVAFPLFAPAAHEGGGGAVGGTSDEMLMMLNQWDGCCIGVPPTPYDAIEVKLREPVAGEERQRITGTVLGVLRVDPYLVKDWLVSLYVMDDAELAPSKSPG